MIRNTARAAIALATVATVLVALALPAAAATGSITAGTINLGTVNPVETYSTSIGTAPPEGAPCPTTGADQTIDIDFDGSGGTMVTGVSLEKVQLEVPAGSGSWYYGNVSLGSGPKNGTISGGTITQNLSLRLTFSRITNPVGTSCDVKTAALCTLQTNMTLTGSWSGGLTPPGTMVVSGGPFPVARAGACNAPFATRFPATAPFASSSATGLTVVF